MGIASEQGEPGRKVSRLRRAVLQPVLAIGYFGVVTPLGLLLRLGGWLRLGKRFAGPAESYWTIPQRPVAQPQSFRRLR